VPTTRVPGRHRSPARPKALLIAGAALAAGALFTGAALLIGGGSGDAVSDPAVPGADFEVGGRPNLITPTDLGPDPSTAAPTPALSRAGTSQAPAPAPSATASESVRPAAPSVAMEPSPSDAVKPSSSDEPRERDDCPGDRHGGNNNGRGCG
jgi:hypothetical protein